jgi:hypothetical protein
MNINDQTRFNQVYQAYLNELTLQGKSPNLLICIAAACTKSRYFLIPVQMPVVQPLQMAKK